jgi:hypothetical protein
MGFAAGDANLYRYVKNSPTTFTDPTGERPYPRPFPQPQPKLSFQYEQIGKPTSDKDGEFNSKVKWLVSNTKKGGVIIQRVSFQWDVEGRLKKEPVKKVDVELYMKLNNQGDFKKSNWPYMEAWTVDKDGKVLESAAMKWDDEVQSVGFTNTDWRTSGLILITLEARYYEGGIIPADYKVVDAAPAGKLRAKYGSGTFPAGDSLAIKRSFQLKWDHLQGDGTTKVTDTGDTRPVNR